MICSICKLEMEQNENEIDLFPTFEKTIICEICREHMNLQANERMEGVDCDG